MQIPNSKLPIKFQKMQELTPYRKRKIRVLTLSEEKTKFIPVDQEHKKINLIDLASNDYLGLARHPNLIKAAYEIMQSEGVGAGSSRLLTGTRPVHTKLEAALSDWLNRESILLFPSGFQANLAAVIALGGRNIPIIADRLIHHSLLVGIRACGGKIKRFAHNDTDDLEKLLKQHTHQKPLVITESLFSMEGTIAPLHKIAELCKRYNAKLLIDEAHALGVMGPQGKGLCFNLPHPITIITGTFGKAFGCGGAFLSCSMEMREHIIQTSGAFRYTTALAPPLAAAALEALKLIIKNPHWGSDLQKESKTWNEELFNKGWILQKHNTQIISIQIGSDQQTLKYQNQLEKKGLLCMAIRPPTVPEGTSRLRIVLRKNLPNDTLSKVISCMNEK